ncbi:MAG: 50S ribosomal protein L13 [Flavobacteriaceae bacterium]|nr:50S ribosomal protein L13 [Flavobacteriaceae bacterium]
MENLGYKTISANKNTVNKNWVVVDVDGLTLGRMASEVAKLLRGKHKPNFTPHVDCGDNVIILNASKIKLTGNKWKNKEYIRHTGYPGGQRSVTAEQLYKKDPTRIVENAIRGMLPKNKLGAMLYRNLKVYTGQEHKHQGQNPIEIKLNKIK